MNNNNNDIKLKQLMFLDDTVKHFNSNNRGVDVINDTCSYTEGCAIGRHLPKELCIRFDSDPNDQCVYSPNIFNELPDWMKELTSSFLSAIQNFHDDKTCWNEKGLTEYGFDVYHSIIKDFKLNDI